MKLLPEHRFRANTEAIESYDYEGMDAKHLNDWLMEWLALFIRDINARDQEIRRIFNLEEGGAAIIEEGDALPTPERALNGKYAMTEKSGGGGEDQLYWCRWNGSAFEWKEII